MTRVLMLFTLVLLGTGFLPTVDAGSERGSQPAGALGSAAGLGRSVTDPTVVLRIEVPETTPEGAEIWISGDRPELGAWNGRGLQATHEDGRAYEVSCTLPQGTVFQFKVTRGSWETVEKGPSGEEIANRTFRVDGSELARVVVASWRDQVEPPPVPTTVSGDVRRHEGFPSAFVSTRDVLVYLPPGYEDHPAQTYPVLYMHDGQNLFDRATSFLGIEWGVDETADRMIGVGELEPLIVVGIDNSGAGRVFDYTPVPGSIDVKRPEGDDGPDDGGGADAYGRFLVEELKPFIDRTYRTCPIRECTGIAGSSLGGLVSLYLGIERSDVFGRVGAVSPSIWWADDYILDYVESRGRRRLRIWIDMGTAESPSAALQARALIDRLTESGWVLGEDLRYLEVEGAPHNEAAWADRVDEMLEYLYGTGAPR